MPKFRDTPPALPDDPTARAQIEQRFWAKVDRRGTDACWPWLAGTYQTGYGAFRLAGRTVSAQVVAYLLDGHQLPPKHVVTQTCREPGCVNPAHLAAMTIGACLTSHAATKTRCANGHPYSADNTMITKHGARKCRICNIQYTREHRARKRLARVAVESDAPT